MCDKDSMIDQLQEELDSLQQEHDGLLEAFDRVQNQEMVLREELLQKSWFLDTVLNSELDIYFKDRESRFILVSRGSARKLTGRDTNPEEVAGLADSDFFGEENARQTRNDELRVMETGEVLTEERTEVYADGRVQEVLTSKAPLFDPTGKLIGTYGITRDITDVVALRRQIEAILNTSKDAIFLMDEEGQTVMANPAAEVLFGHPLEDLIGEDLHELFQPAELFLQTRESLDLFHGNGPRSAEGITLELEAVRSDGERFPAEVSINGVEIQGQKFGVGIVRDISGWKRAEKRLKDLAELDGLTGLLNQTTFPKKIQAQIESDEPGHYVVIVGDLNRFKPVNDLHGHEVGDRLLRSVGQRMVECVKNRDLVGRLGGDEFGIGMRLDPEADSASRLEKILTRRLRQIAVRIGEPYSIWDGKRQKRVLVDQLGVSLGYAIAADSDAQVGDLMMEADRKMYEAKKRSRQTI